MKFRVRPGTNAVIDGKKTSGEFDAPKKTKEIQTYIDKKIIEEVKDAITADK